MIWTRKPREKFQKGEKQRFGRAELGKNAGDTLFIAA
jgi:hypothetical protein